MSQREPMTDASLQQFLNDFIESLAKPPEYGQAEDVRAAKSAPPPDPSRRRSHS